MPSGTTRTVYNLRSAPFKNATTAAAPVTTTTVGTTVAVGRGGSNPQVVQMKQEPALLGKVVTPKMPTTMVRRGKGRGQGTSTISVVETLPEEDEYLVEVAEEDLEGSDSDVTELYAILVDMAGTDEEIENELEPEIEPTI